MKSPFTAEESVRARFVARVAEVDLSTVGESEGRVLFRRDENRRDDLEGTAIDGVNGVEGHLGAWMGREMVIVVRQSRDEYWWRRSSIECLWKNGLLFGDVSPSQLRLDTLSTRPLCPPK